VHEREDQQQLAYARARLGAYVPPDPPLFRRLLGGKRNLAMSHDPTLLTCEPL
jgi:hypothetical protein